MDIDPLPAMDFVACLPAVIAGSAVWSWSQTIALIIAALCLLVSGFVSGSEISFFSLTPSQLDELDADSRGSSIKRLLSKPEQLLATILIANNTVNVTIVVLTNFALGPVFDGMSEVLSFVLQTILLTFLILLFGEILPKLYANNFPLTWARFACGPLSVMMTLFKPLSRLLVSSTTIVRRVVTKQPNNITADDLSQALEITDVAAGEDKNMLEGILKFGDRTAAEIMTPRIDITDLDVSMSFDEVLRVVIDSGFSRLPVYEGNEDNILGILFARDLLPYIGKDVSGFKWQSLLHRPPYCVPETRMIDDLLEDFRKRKEHLAIVVDEFGGTQGIVTLEDVLEEIVGDIDDEYDEPDTTYQRLRDGTFVFEGRTLLTDFFRVTELDSDAYEDVTGEAETLAGMLLNIKGDIPKEKEPMVYGRCRFLILDVTDHRIVSVRVKIMPDEQTC